MRYQNLSYPCKTLMKISKGLDAIPDNNILYGYGVSITISRYLKFIRTQSQPMAFLTTFDMYRQ